MSTGPAAPKRRAPAIPAARLPRPRIGFWGETDLGGGDALIPDNQDQDDPPGERDEHVGQRVISLAREFSNLADEKLNIKASMETLQQLS